MGPKKLTEYSDKAKAMTTGNDYRYKTFTAKLLLRDMRFHKSAPKSGEPFPEFKLEAVDGISLSKHDFIGSKPLLLIFGSLTCPMTASAMPKIERLHDKFGDRVEFVLMNVREAHPGELLTQPDSPSSKLEHARQLKQLYGADLTVATDDIEGSLHRALDPKPNAAFIMDIAGNIVFRSLWASDEKALTQALDNLVHNNPQHKTQSQKMLVPVVKAMGHVHEVMQRGGPQATRDLWIAGFPMALAGRIAALFQPLPKDARGITAVSILSIVMFLIAGAIVCS